METAVPIVDQHPASHRTLKVLKDEERHLPAAQEPAATRRDPDAGGCHLIPLVTKASCSHWLSAVDKQHFMLIGSYFTFLRVLFPTPSPLNH